MNVEINILELASELADKKLTELQNRSIEINPQYPVFPNGIVKENEVGEVVYTEEAQEVFNQYYDDFYTLIEGMRNRSISERMDDLPMYSFGRTYHLNPEKHYFAHGYTQALVEEGIPRRVDEKKYPLLPVVYGSTLEEVISKAEFELIKHKMKNSPEEQLVGEVKQCILNGAKEWNGLELPTPQRTGTSSQKLTYAEMKARDIVEQFLNK